MVQLHSYLYTTGKTISFTMWAFVSKVMSLLFNMLSRFVIAFLPRSDCLLISQLQSLEQTPGETVEDRDAGVLQSEGSQGSDMTQQLYNNSWLQSLHP